MFEKPKKNEMICFDTEVMIKKIKRNILLEDFKVGSSELLMKSAFLLSISLSISLLRKKMFWFSFSFVYP